MGRLLQPISNDLVLNRMKFENPWWITGEVDEEYQGYQRRAYFELFFPLVEEVDIRRAVVLMGPRRVGKTVMMNHAIESLLKSNNILRNNICFINIENPLYLNMGLDELFTMARESVGNKNPKGWYVFFDEIQYLKNWEVHLKVLVDSYPHTKFIVSGSAAAALKLKSSESGAGRFTEFMLPPLTFYEYINLKNEKHLLFSEMIDWGSYKSEYQKTNNIQELNKHFIDYINFGGYPEVIFSKKIQSNPSRYIKSDIVDKVLLRDLPSLYGIHNVQELNAFFTMLVYYCGNEVSLESLSISSSVNKPTLSKYLEYLEAAFLIKRIQRIDDCGKKFTRNNFYKIYLTNPSLRSALFSPLSATDDAMGNMVETAIFSQWMLREKFTPYYARWGKNGDGEVDIVSLGKNLKPNWAVEIKWTNKYYGKPELLKSLLSFCNKNKLDNPFITTLDKEGAVEYNGMHLNFTPSSVYAYNVGYNAVKHKLSLT